MACIVVAEDDSDIHMLVQMLLEEQGHDVVMAKDGAQAVDAVASSHVDLVLLDVAMPGELDGLAVTRLLRSDPAHADLPILLLSARARANDVKLGLAAGASGYIVKPFDAEALLGRVASLVSDGA